MQMVILPARNIFATAPRFSPYFATLDMRDNRKTAMTAAMHRVPAMIAIA
jgi:hypothetical protein